MFCGIVQYDADMHYHDDAARDGSVVCGIAWRVLTPSQSIAEPDHVPLLQHVNRGSQSVLGRPDRWNQTLRTV